MLPPSSEEQAGEQQILSSPPHISADIPDVLMIDR